MIKIKHVKQIVITLDNGDQTNSLTYLGRGRYCQAYTDYNEVYLLVPQDEFGKDILVDCQYDRIKLVTPHIPAIEYLGDTVKKRVFKMDYIRTITAKDKKAWKLVRDLEKIRIETWSEYSKRARAENKLVSVFGHDIATDTIEKANVPESIKKALEALIGSASNYGSSYTFEFNKRNIGIDSKGNIVFRDCIFDIEDII